MRNLSKVLLTGMLGLTYCTSHTASFRAVKVPIYTAFQSETLVPWNSTEGQLRLARTPYKADFFQLAHSYQPQINPLYCGIASSVLVLNAIRQPTGSAPSQEVLEVPLPNGNRVAYPAYSQLTLLNQQTDRIKPREIIEFRHPVTVDPGLTLGQLEGILKTYELNAYANHAEFEPTTGVTQLRDALQKYLQDTTHFVLLNFRGKEMGAPTGGHISPVVAYDQESDSALILDVAGHKNPWYWAPLTDLYAAMHTEDGDNYRGWVVVTEQ